MRQILIFLTETPGKKNPYRIEPSNVGNIYNAFLTVKQFNRVSIAK